MKTYTIEYEWENPDGGYDYDSSFYGCDEDTAREDYDTLIAHPDEYDSRLEDCKLLTAMLKYTEEDHGITCDDGILEEFNADKPQPIQTIPRIEFYAKSGRNWKRVESMGVTTDAETVYRSLTEDMVFRYIHKSPVVKSVKRTQNYDGTNTITVTLGEHGDVRRVYTVPNM